MSSELGQLKKMGMKELGLRRKGGPGISPHVAAAGRISAEDYTIVLAKQQEVCAEVDRSPFYFYTVKEPTNLTSLPFISPETIIVWYNPLLRSSQKFGTAQDVLFNVGEKLHKGIEDADQLVGASREILDNGYFMTNFLNNFQEAPASGARVISVLRPPEQLKVRRAADEVGTSKPDTYAETLRRYMPRWMWHPLSSSTEDVPEGKTDAIRAAWNGYSTTEASMLIHGDRLAEEKSPLHMVFRAADKLDAKGERDLSYTVRTRAVLDLLAMERERSQEQYLHEMPFFTYMFGGAMTGEVGKAPKNAHFDYATAVNDLMLQTFTRFQTETDTNQPGRATKFLQEVSQFYPDHFEEIMARSLTTHSRSSDAFDEVSILKGALAQNFPWAEGVVEEMQYVPESRVLTTKETRELVATLPPVPEGDPISAEACMENVAKILGDEDIFSFSDGIHDKTVNAALNVDLDSFSETMEVTVQFNSRDGKKTVPFSLSFTGERESLHMDLLTPEGLDENTAEVLRQNTLRSLQKVVEKKNQKEKKQQTATPVFPPAESITQRFRVATTTRAERLAEYDERREKKKTRGVPGAQVVYQRAEVAPETAVSHSGIVIDDLNYQTVSDLLEREKINIVSPEKVMSRLSHAVEEAGARGSSVIGKRVTLEHRHGNLAEGLKLFQVNWIVEGKIQLRIYLVNAGSGHLKLVGMLNKKGADHQNRYLEGLIHRINESELVPV